MKFYFAPMEGITGFVYRNLYQSYFHNIDKYFTPFIVGNKKASMRARELRDVLPENNPDITIVPQILTCDVEEFVSTVGRLKTLGFNEVNLNLGCPSGTVVSKGRGAGFLAKPKELKEFLSRIFEETDVEISLKTRLGMEFVSEFDELLDIYRSFPLKELIIHPRVRKELYSGTPHYEEFEKAYETCSFPVCYNGDIFTVSDYQKLTDKFPKLDRVMLGRGILANPFLVDRINGVGREITGEFIEEFTGRLFEEYRRELSGDRDVLFKMKELWSYQIWMFEDEGRYIKEIRKAKNKTEYDVAVRNLIRNSPINGNAGLFNRV